MKPIIPVFVAIPTHPRRGRVDDPGTLLGRAVASVYAQTVEPLGISLVMDLGGDGAAVTRQRALDEGAGKFPAAEFVSFLDSDDWMYPNHLEVHYGLLREHGADVAYSWFGGNEPFPESTHRGIPFDNAHPHHITMTITVRVALARQIGFPADPLHPDWTGEDWAFITGLAAAGAKFVGTGETTWFYDAGHGNNTSGSARRGDGPLSGV